MTGPLDRSAKEPGIRADSHTARGVALIAGGRLREAIAEFREAVRLVPENAIARGNLGMTLGRAGGLDGDEANLAEAVDQLRTAVRLQPGNVGLYHKLAAVLAIADRAPDALSVLEEALRLDPGNAGTRGLRSVALLTLGDFENGWLDFHSRQDDPARHARDIPGVPRWRGEMLSGTLLINGWAEGQGDCIQGIRFAAEARRRVGDIILGCLPSMARLLGRCGGSDRVLTSRESVPAIAAQISPMYLAGIFRPIPGAMRSDPYLSVDPAAAARWRPVVAAIPGFRVGITWQGNPANVTDALRSFPLGELAPLAEVPGVSLVGLQKGPGTGCRPDSPLSPVDLGPEYQAGDWLDTAAVISHLDLVISPDTAIAHLGGALGKTTWLALPRPAEWRWMRDREDSPWYPSMRLFRQDRPGEWGPVFRRMSECLSEVASRPHC